MTGTGWQRSGRCPFPGHIPGQAGQPDLAEDGLALSLAGPDDL